MRVLADNSHRRIDGRVRGGKPERNVPETEVAHADDVVRRKALCQIFDPVQAADAEVIVTQRHLYRDVLLSKHACHRIAIEHRKAERPRSGSVFPDAETGSIKHACRSLAKVAGG